MHAGDTVFPTPDGSCSFMYSFPNLVPLPAQEVARIGSRLQQYSFERMYGAFPHAVVRSGAAGVVQAAVRRYCGMLEGTLHKVFY